jgi:hypothetical protein
MYVGIVSEDLDDAMKDGPSGGLWCLVVLSGDEDTTADCSRGGVENVQGGIPHLAVIAKNLYGDTE